jgi:histidinol phosphatase-like enzyme
MSLMKRHVPRQKHEFRGPRKTMIQTLLEKWRAKQLNKIIVLSADPDQKRLHANFQANVTTWHI